MKKAKKALNKSAFLCLYVIMYQKEKKPPNKAYFD
nr:MAG TPA: hypothetical protein [Caudoviricetes sp.]